MWTEDKIKELLKTNKTMVLRSLIKLYDCQTTEEKNSKTTRVYNGKGFNACDATILTSIAEFYLIKGFISDKQYDIVYKKIQKYAKQLTAIANA